jgi:ribosomal protein S18 acetylase RimI-like enzyme
MVATIRPVTLDDYDAMHDLLEELHAMHVEGMPELFKMPKDAILEREHVAGLVRDPQSRLLAAQMEDGALAGFVWAHIDDVPENSTERGRLLLVVEMLQVSDEYQGRGIGKSLMHEVHEWGVAQGATHAQLYVWAFNGRALSFYEGQGYGEMVIGMSRALR